MSIENLPTQFPELELSGLLKHYLRLSASGKMKVKLVYFLCVIYFSLPGLQIPILEYSTVRHSSLMDERIIENYFYYFPSQSAVPLEAMAPALIKCTIGMEDDAFFQHHGVNWYELEKSMALNKKKKKASRGGSTITMQLAKNLFFTTNRSVVRKAKEILTTFRMEKEISKNAILEQYFNIIEWGNGVFGAREASLKYYSKEPDKISINEAARLAAVIPAPLKFNPTESKRFVTRRSAIVKTRSTSVQFNR